MDSSATLRRKGCCAAQARGSWFLVGHICHSAFEFEHLNRIEPQDFSLHNRSRPEIARAALNLKRDVRNKLCCPFASWLFQPKWRKKSARPFGRLFSDSPRTGEEPPTLPRALTACAHSSPAKTPEISSPSTPSPGLRPLPSLA